MKVFILVFLNVIFHIHFFLDSLFIIAEVNFIFIPYSNPSQENSSVIYFGSSFIFENNSVGSEIFIILNINCENLYIGIILYFKADFHFKENNSSDRYHNKNIFVSH